MGFGDKLFDDSVIPQGNKQQNSDFSSVYMNMGAGACPVRFTEDPIEYCESKEYLGIHLRPLQKAFILDLYSTDDKGHQKYEEGILVAGMRGGKSCRIGTKILMLDGSLKN